MHPFRPHQPRSLAEAVEILVESLEPHERAQFRACGADCAVVIKDCGLGRTLRYVWLSGGRGSELRAEANPYSDDRRGPKVGADEISATLIQRAWRILKEQS